MFKILHCGKGKCPNLLFFSFADSDVDHDLKYKEHDFSSSIQNTLVASSTINIGSVLDILDSIGSLVGSIHQYHSTPGLSFRPFHSAMDESISISLEVGLVSSILQPNNITLEVLSSKVHIISKLFQNVTLPKA